MSPAADTTVTIGVAATSEAAAIAHLTHRAFQSQAALYQDDTLPPLLDTEESVAAAMHDGVVLVARDAQGGILGSVRGTEHDGTCWIGRLVVDPSVQNRGIGRALARALEERFSEAARFEIFTGHRSEPALHLYESLGYRRYRIAHVHEHLDLVYLEKTTSAPRVTP